MRHITSRIYSSPDYTIELVKFSLIWPPSAQHCSPTYCVGAVIDGISTSWHSTQCMPNKKSARISTIASIGLHNRFYSIFFFWVISMLASPPHMTCMKIQYYSSNRQLNQIACKFLLFRASFLRNRCVCVCVCSAQRTMLLILVQLHISTSLAAWKYFIKNCISAYSLMMSATPTPAESPAVGPSFHSCCVRCLFRFTCFSHFYT